MDKYYYGEEKCSGIKRNGEKCNNKAYYIYENKLRCGVHSKKENRKKLKINTNKNKLKEDLLLSRKKLVEKYAQENFENKRKGNVILTKLYMMKEPEHIDGYLKVFPNYKHGNRKDGFGCSSLSPKSIGPINHGQPELPIALNLENFWQFSKVFKNESDEKGNPLPIFYQTQIKGYLDPIRHRHKEVIKKFKGNKNIPLYFIWRIKDNNKIGYKELHLSYYESREIYCKFYEKLTKNNEALKGLKCALKSGYNLQIIGYDSYDVKNKDIYECYKNTSKPFGHELVLYCLLTIKKKENYPWNKFGKLNL